MYKKIILGLVLLFVFLVPAFTHQARAFDWNATHYLDKVASQPGVELKSNKSVSVIAGKIINSVVAMLGVIFLVLILYAGYLFLTAGGSSEDVHTALMIIKWSIIGAIIIFGAYAISFYIVSHVSQSI